MYSTHIDTIANRCIQPDPVLCRFLQQSAEYLGFDAEVAIELSTKPGYSKSRPLPAEGMCLRH
jgi:hypothetical protein